ncbi:TPR-like protein [Piedraia hortae CBS 480.64]|uniref:TPR-like protein n=1 Tax=Piedraia hortae CBS 480.64 TaxID=1314780 RepID=A0A6A7C662_9PEZI|nr:TPR-like protein [Piedraia hortae CBS 480.64]
MAPVQTNTAVVADKASQNTVASQTFWERASSWYAENKVAAWTIAGVTIVAVGGSIYYLSQPQSELAEKSAESKKSKKSRSKKQPRPEPEKQQSSPKGQPSSRTATVQTEEEDLPNITAETVDSLSEQDRKDAAAKLKAAGNKLFGAKDYDSAISLYDQAILCQADPVFYSNRAACWHALGDWSKVVNDTTAALNFNPEYVKALNRRAHAYEQLEQYSDALLDYTASCIIDQFQNATATQSIERLLKKVAEVKAKKIVESRENKLPSPVFVSNYLQAFRQRPLPKGLEESDNLVQSSGKWYLRQGLQKLQQRSREGYAEASEIFDKAIVAGDLGEHEAYAYNMRGTFRYLHGDNEAALKDLNRAIELDPSFTQNYVKRASIHLEQNEREKSAADFDLALQHNAEDPDIFYHRAQLHFVLNEFPAAAKDYQKSIDLDPDFIFSHVQLGVTQYKMGSVANSMATFRRCLKNFGDKGDVYNYYGELLLDLQKYQEAVEKFETAFEMEKKHTTGVPNVLPLINKALALIQWKQDLDVAEKLCNEALEIDPECDIAVATMAQLLLQQGKVTEALGYFERAAKLSRTEGEVVNALSYAEATRTQLEVQQKYPQLAPRLQGMGNAAMAGAMK